MAYLPPGGGRMNVTIGGNTAGVGSLISTGTLALAGGNNIQLSQNGANGITINGASAGSNTFGMSNLGNTSGTTGVVSGSAMRFAFAGGNNVTLNQSLNGSSGTITIIAPNSSSLSATGIVSLSANGSTLSIGAPAFSAGMSSSTYGGATGGTSGTASNQVVIAAGSNITLSQSTGAGGNTLAIYGPNALTSQSNQALSGSNGSIAFQTATLGNLNGLSFYTSNGSMVGSYTVPTVTNSSFTVQAGASTLSSVSRMAFGDGNGISFGASTSNNGSITITGTVATNYAASNHSHGNPTLNLTNLSGTTASASNGLTLSLSAAAPGGGAGLSAGTQSVSTGTVSFANSNGITFGMSGSNQITASHNGITNLNFSAGTTSNNLSKVTFADSNGVSFGLNGSAVTATVATNYAASNHSHGNPTLNLTNISGTTASASNGFTLSLSAAAPGAGGGIALSASNSAFTSGTVSLANAGGALTIGTAAQQINFAVPQTSSISATGAVSVSLSGSTISIGAPAFSAGLSNIGNTTGTSGMQTNRVVFAGGNNINLSQSNDANGATITISGSGGGGVGLANSQTTYTSGNVNLLEGGGAITIASSAGGQSFKVSVPAVSSLVGTNGISVSTAGSTISIDGAGLSTLAGGATYSYYNPQDAYLQVTGQQGQGSLHIQPTPAPNVSFDRFVFPINFSGSSNSTGSITMSMWAGIYTRNVSTLSLSTSFSTSQGITHSGNVNSSLNNGQKLFTMGATGSLSEGQYYVGILSRTTSGGGNASISQMLASQLNSAFAGIWGVSSAATNQFTRGLGVYTASTSAMPNSIAFSQLNGTATLVLRQPLFYVINGTV
ncbi:MAG: hypothetical protein ABIR37_01135 [Candidatus Saccharimonadales bacterium]